MTRQIIPSRKVDQIKRNIAKLIDIIFVLVGFAILFLTLTRGYILSNITVYQQVVLSFLSFIAIGIGLERLFLSSRLESNQEEILARLGVFEKNLGGVFLEDWDQVYQEATNLIKHASFQINATSLGRGPGSAPPDYLETIANRIAQLKERKKHLSYNVVFGEKERLTSQYSKIKDVFSRLDVDSSFYPYLGELDWDIDLLIVDNKSFILAFFDREADSAIRFGLKFVEQPSLIEEMSKIYYERLMKPSKKIEQEMIDAL